METKSERPGASREGQTGAQVTDLKGAAREPKLHPEVNTPEWKQQVQREAARAVSDVVRPVRTRK